MSPYLKSILSEIQLNKKTVIELSFSGLSNEEFTQIFEAFKRPGVVDTINFYSIDYSKTTIKFLTDLKEMLEHNLLIKNIIVKNIQHGKDLFESVLEKNKESQDFLLIKNLCKQIRMLLLRNKLIGTGCLNLKEYESIAEGETLFMASELFTKAIPGKSLTFYHGATNELTENLIDIIFHLLNNNLEITKVNLQFRLVNPAIQNFYNRIKNFSRPILVIFQGIYKSTSVTSGFAFVYINKCVEYSRKIEIPKILMSLVDEETKKKILNLIKVNRLTDENFTFLAPFSTSLYSGSPALVISKSETDREIDEYLLINKKKLEIHNGLRVINLNGIRLTTERINYLFSEREAFQFSSLQVEGCYIDNEGLKSLMKFFNKMPNLCHLNLANNNVTDDGLTNFFDESATLNLYSLDISKNGKLSGRCINSLCEWIKKSISISILDLGSSKIIETSLGLIAAAIKINKSLTILKIAQENYNKDQFQSFLDKIKGSDTLCFLEGYDKIVHERFVPRDVYLDSQKYNHIWNSLDRILSKNRQAHIEMHDATISNDVGTLERHLSSGRSLYYRYQNGDTLLHVAVKYGNIDIIKLLLARGFNQNILNDEGKTALDCADEVKRPQITELFRSAPSAGSVATAPSNYFPSSSGSSEEKKRKGGGGVIVSGTKRTKPSLTTPSTLPKNTLHNYFQSALFSQKSVLTTPSSAQTSALIATNTQPNAMSGSLSLYTIKPEILYYASLNGRTEEFKNLPPSIDLNFIYQGSTLLHAAAQNAHIEIVNILLTANGNANIVDLRGRSALHTACLYADSLPTYEVIEKLLKFDLLPHQEDNEGLTPLYILAGGFDDKLNTNHSSRNLRKSIELLINKTKNLNQQFNDLAENDRAYTLLHKAASRGNYFLAKKLLFSKRVDICAQNENKDTALHIAIRNSAVDIVRILLLESEKNRLLSIQNQQGQTPLSLVNDLLKQNSSDNSIIKIKRLIEEALQYQVPDKNPGTKWVPTFKFFYGYGKDNEFIIDLNDLHSSLWEGVNNNRTNYSQGNLLAAAITFVISTPSPSSSSSSSKNCSSKKLLHVRLDGKEACHVSDNWRKKEIIEGRVRSKDMELRILSRIDAAPTDIKVQLSNNPQEVGKALSTTAVENLYKASARNDEKNFEELFNHAENALLDELNTDELQNLIVEKVKKELSSISGHKVVAVILNLASAYYSCLNCEVGILGEQSGNWQQGFITGIQKKLAAQGYSVASPLRVLTCVSVKQPCRGRQKVGRDRHEDLKIDLRQHYGNIILQRDMNETTTHYRPFVSRKK